MPDIPPTSADATAVARECLRACLQQQTESLLSAICVYLHRSGLAQGGGVQAVALEVFQETAVEALTNSDRFDIARSPIAWLLGIALNVIRRRRVEQAMRLQRELPISWLATEQMEGMSEQDLLDQLTSARTHGPEQETEAADAAERLLALVSPADQEILRLALLEDHARETLAERFETTSGAVRVRLHRALGRLRIAWQAQEGQADE